MWCSIYAVVPELTGLMNPILLTNHVPPFSPSNCLGCLLFADKQNIITEINLSYKWFVTKCSWQLFDSLWKVQSVSQRWRRGALTLEALANNWAKAWKRHRVWFSLQPVRTAACVTWLVKNLHVDQMLHQSWDNVSDSGPAFHQRIIAPINNDYLIRGHALIPDNNVVTSSSVSGCVIDNLY